MARFRIVAESMAAGNDWTFMCADVFDKFNISFREGDELCFLNTTVGF